MYFPRDSRQGSMLERSINHCKSAGCFVLKILYNGKGKMQLYLSQLKCYWYPE